MSKMALRWLVARHRGGRIEHTHKTWISSAEGIGIGQDSLTPINENYTIANSRFSATLEKVTIRIDK